MEGDVFLDGSCSKEWHPHLDRASWAIAKLSEDSQRVVASLVGPVWESLPQTSPCSEYVALAALAQVASNPLQSYIDFSGAFAARQKEVGSLLNNKSLYAGIFRSVVNTEG